MLNTRAAVQHKDFDLSPSERSLLELNAFLQSPRSIGIDSLKESLSNVVRYMLELQGLDTGQDTQLLFEEQHDSISLNEKPSSKKNKRKRLQDEADLMMRLEEQMALNFDKLYVHVEKQLDNVSANISNEIEKLDEQIDALEDSQGDNSVKLQSRRERRQRLKAFKQRVKAYQKEIKLASENMDTARLIEIEQNLHQDHEAFNQRGIFPPQKRAPNILDIFGGSKTVEPLFPEGHFDLGLKSAVDDLASGANDLVDQLLRMAKFEAKNPNPDTPVPDAD